jgi:hypothetical protein
MMKGFSKKNFVIMIFFLFFVGLCICVSAENKKTNIATAQDEDHSFFSQSLGKKIYTKQRLLTDINLDNLNIFSNVKLKSFKIYTKWIDDNDTVFEKTYPLSTNSNLIDINNDSVDDVKLVFDFGLKIIKVEDYDFSGLSFPYVLGFVTSIETVRIDEGCVDDFDFFEIHFQAGFPSFLGLEEKEFQIGGFRSDEGSKNPQNFKTTHKFIPYFLRNLLGFRKSPEFWVSQNPGDIETGIEYLVGVEEIENDDKPYTSMVLNNKPAKSFDLKIKMGLDEDSRFKFNSKDGVFEDLSFALKREKNNKKIGGSFSFKNLERVDFDADLNIKEDKASVFYLSRNNLDFDFKFFNEEKDSLFKTGVLWDKGKSFSAEMIKGSSFSVKTSRVLDFYDLSFEKPGFDLILDRVVSEKSGSFGISLTDAGFDFSSDIKLDVSNLGFINNNYSVNVGILKPNLAGMFSVGQDEESRGFKIGGDMGLFVDEISFESFVKDVDIDVSGGIDVESGGWMDLYKTSDDVNHVELKLLSLSFEFSDVDFSFNHEKVNLRGLFDFGEDKERVLHFQWKKPDIFEFEFDRDVGLTASDFHVGMNTGWLFDYLDIDSFSWNNGRRFLIDVADDGLNFETSTDLDIHDLSMVFKNGAEISSANTFFEGGFQVEWFEEQLFLDVQSNIDWDLKIDTPLFGVWNINGIIDGEVQINSNWLLGESGSLEFVSSSNGVLHDFFIEHEKLELHLGTIDLTPGNIVLDWKRGDNGYLELNNNGISASLDVCKIIHPPTLFSFEVGSIDLTPGDSSISWENSTDLKHLNLESGIDFDVDFVKLSQKDSVLEVSGLGVKPGVFDFKWYKVDNKMQMTNSISGFGPKVSLLKNNELFEASINDLSNNGKTFTLEWYKEENSVTGFSVDTDGQKCAEWLECSYKLNDNYGRKLALTGLKADGFTIRNQDSKVTLGGRIGGSRLIYHDHRNGEWHMLSDSIWDINGDGQGYFSTECDPDWTLEISPLILIADYDIEIDSTVYAPSFFNLTWDFDLNTLIPLDAYANISLDTDGKTIGNIDLEVNAASWFNMSIEGNTIAAEDFWVYCDFDTWNPLNWQITNGGTINPASELSIYLLGVLVYEYP